MKTFQTVLALTGFAAAAVLSSCTANIEADTSGRAPVTTGSATTTTTSSPYVGTATTTRRTTTTQY